MEKKQEFVDIWGGGDFSRCEKETAPYDFRRVALFDIGNSDIKLHEDEEYVEQEDFYRDLAKDYASKNPQTALSSTKYSVEAQPSNEELMKEIKVLQDSVRLLTIQQAIILQKLEK